MENGPLFGLRVDIRPHLLGGIVFFDSDLPLVNLILDVKILDLDVFCPLGATCFSITLEQDSSHVVLIVIDQ